MGLRACIVLLAMDFFTALGFGDYDLFLFCVFSCFGGEGKGVISGMLEKMAQSGNQP